ncbi:MAG: hypothetical protein GY936_19315, partial [Ignavibacteriae bacterium]|nr:hypothetical protein [Ignavibacteriota bacterium]
KRRNSIQYYDIILSDKGVKKYVIDKFIPLMNQLINKYLEELGLSISFHLDGKFDETIKSRYRDDFSYESFSEGEKLRIDLSLLFAWREIARMRNSSNFPLLIFDEITDRSLDYDGQMAFLGFLKKIKGSIVIISHNDSIKDSCRNIIEVKKIGNFSQHV